MSRVSLEPSAYGLIGRRVRQLKEEGGLGWLVVYKPGTLIEVTGYTTESGSTKVTYPLTADANGHFPDAWFEPGSYDLYVPGIGRTPWKALLFAYHGGVSGLGPGNLILPASRLEAPFGPFPPSYDDPYRAHLGNPYPRSEVSTYQDLGSARSHAAAWPEGDVYEVEMHNYGGLPLGMTSDELAVCQYATVVKVVETKVFRAGISENPYGPFMWHHTKRPVVVTNTW